ncbi:MAG: alpha/beta fold hydrolase, partial [Acidimicrobiales bacterium]
EQYRLEHLVADVLAVADQLGGHRIDLVGHDWGGAVAWLVAARHPQRVRTLTSVSTPHPAVFAATLAGGDQDQTARSSYIAFFRQQGAAQVLLAGDGAGLRNLFESSGHPDQRAVEEYMRVLREPGALHAALHWYRAVSADDVGDGTDVAVPTMFVWGDRDLALGRAAAEGSGDHVSGPYRFEVLEGVGHWIPEDVPDRLNRLLLDHLAAHQ